MDQIENLLRCLPTQPDIEKWKKRLDDTHATFKNDVDRFRLEFMKQNEIIARYDEVINEKVNKHTVKELDKKIKESIITLKAQMSLSEKTLKKEID